MQFIQNAEKLFQSIDSSLFSYTSSTTLHILFGSSTFSPRVAYTIHFPPAQQTACHDNSLPAPLIPMQSSQFLRDFMVLFFNHQVNDLCIVKKMKVHILFSHSSGDTAIWASTQDRNKDFAFRHNWSLRMLRGVHASVTLVPPGQYVELDDDYLDSIVLQQSRHVLKGIVKPLLS